MAGPYRVSFVFKQWRQGWVESWYLTSANSINQAMIQVCGLLRGFTPDSIAYARFNLVGYGVILQAIRIADTTSRATLLNYIGGVPSQVGGPTAATIAQPAWNAILCDVRTLAGYKRKEWLRGVPASWIKMDSDGEPLPPPADFTTRFNAWRQAVVPNPNAAGILGVRAINKARVPTYKFPITAVTSANGGASTTIKAPGNIFNLGDEVRVKRVKGLHLNKNVNNRWQVMTPFLPGDSFTIPVLFDPLLPQLYQGKGYCYAMAPVIDGVANMSFNRFDKRDTGGIFFVPRGRRSARR